MIREIVNDVLARSMPSSSGSTRPLAASRSPRSAYSELRCCRRSTRSVPSVSSWSRSTTICCFAGSSDWVSTIPSGTTRRSRDRLLDADVAAKFLEAVLRHPKVNRFLSDDHFSIDGTLVEAWASLKSFRAKDGSDEPPSPGRNGERDFHGETRANDTHASKTDPDAKLFRKGKNQAAKLCFMGHAMTGTVSSCRRTRRRRRARPNGRPHWR